MFKCFAEESKTNKYSNVVVDFTEKSDSDSEVQ